MKAEMSAERIKKLGETWVLPEHADTAMVELVVAAGISNSTLQALATLASTGAAGLTLAQTALDLGADKAERQQMVREERVFKRHHLHLSSLEREHQEMRLIDDINYFVMQFCSVVMDAAKGVRIHG